MAQSLTDNDASTSRILTQSKYTDPIKITNTLQGTIWRATRSQCNESVVIKVTNTELHSQSLTIIDGKKYKVEENICKERAVLKYLSKKENADNYIAKYIASFKSNTSYFLVLQDAGNSVLDFVSKAHQFILMDMLSINEWRRVVKCLFQQMVECVHFVHSHHIAHFDVSLENFLINDLDIIVTQTAGDGVDKFHFLVDEGKGAKVRLCDFGLSHYFKPQQHDEDPAVHSFQSSKYCGKPNYQSPEIAMKQPTFNAQSNDVFCLGVCLFMMVVGFAPWNTASAADVAFVHCMNGEIEKLLSCYNRLDYVDQDTMHFLASFFQFEDQRISIQQLKQHKWFNGQHH